MKITMKTAKKMMDAIAYTLCKTICQEEEFQILSDEELTNFVNDTTRKIFVNYCEEEGIEEVELEEE